MNVWGVTFGGCLAKILSFKLGNLLYKSNFYLLSEGTVQSSSKYRARTEMTNEKQINKNKKSEVRSEV